MSFTKVFRTASLQNTYGRLLLNFMFSMKTCKEDINDMIFEKLVLGKLPSRKIVPSPNSNANPKPNPDPDRGAIFQTPKNHMTLNNLFDSLVLKAMVSLQTN